MLFRFAAGGESLVPTIETLLRAPRRDQRGRRRARLSSTQLFPDEGMVAIVPGGFDEHATDVRVAGLGDRATRPVRPARVLGREETDIRHQAAGRRKPARVAQFSGNRQCREIVHPTEAAQALHPTAQWFECHQLLQLSFDRTQASHGFVDRAQIGFMVCVSAGSGQVCARSHMWWRSDHVLLVAV